MLNKVFFYIGHLSSLLHIAAVTSASQANLVRTLAFVAIAFFIGFFIGLLF